MGRSLKAGESEAGGLGGEECRRLLRAGGAAGGEGTTAGGGCADGGAAEDDGGGGGGGEQVRGCARCEESEEEGKAGALFGTCCLCFLVGESCCEGAGSISGFLGCAVCGAVVVVVMVVAVVSESGLVTAEGLELVNGEEALG